MSHPCQSDGAASWVGVLHLQISQYDGFFRRFMTCIVVEVFLYEQVNDLQAVLLKTSYRVAGNKTRFLFRFLLPVVIKTNAHNFESAFAESQKVKTFWIARFLSQKLSR